MVGQLDQHRDLVSVPGSSTIEVLGATISCNITSTNTNGAFALIECYTPPHFRGLPAHRHARTTQVFYVLDGSLAFTLDDVTLIVGRGTSIRVPPGTLHTCWNPTAAPVSFLIWCSPGGLEQCLTELVSLTAAEPAWQPGDRYNLTALAAQYDVFASDEW